MSSSLDFTINLGGNFVEALEKSQKGLKGTEDGAKGAAKELELFEGELGKVRAGALGLNFNAFQDGGHFLTFDLAEGAALAYEGIKKLVEGVVELGSEIVHAAGAAEDLNLAIKLDVGKEGLGEVNELAESFKGTRFDDNYIKNALLPILEESGDEHREQWNDLVTAATDVATRRNKGAAGAASALDALRSIEIQPQKVRGALKELGIKQVDFYDDLGDLLGISAKSAEAQTKAGKIKAQTLLSVALNQIAEREGGALGNATNEGAKTLGSTLARLSNLKENLFEGLANSPGMDAVNGFLQNFIDTMEGPIGTDLVNKISDAFVSLFGDLSGPEGLSKVEDAIKRAAGWVGSLIDGFREAWPEIKSDFEAALPVFEALAKSLATIIEVMGKLPKLGEAIGDFVYDAQNPFQKLPEGKDPLARWLFGDDKQKTHPTAATVDFGSAADMGIPAFADGGIVNGPTIALVGEAGREAIVPLDRYQQMMGDATPEPQFAMPSITYAPVFQAQGAPHEQRQQLEEFEQQHRVAFQRLLQEFVTSVGG